METIEISSSDEEEVQVAGDHREQSDNFRTLPHWANKPVSNKRTSGYGESSQSFHGGLSNVNDHSQTKRQMHSSYGGINGEPNRYSSRADGGSFLGNGNENRNQIRTVNSRIANATSSEYEKISSQQALKRTLPASLEPYASGTRSNNKVENGSSGQVRSTYGNSYPSAVPSTSNGSGYMKGYSVKDNDDDDIVMYENNKNRVLPPSFVPVKPISSSKFGAPSDSAYRTGVAEEKAADTDERLVYQAALQDLNQQKVEVHVPEGLLTVTLLRHQRIALAWMLQKETRSLHCLGGILADDQGLGKTVSVIALVQMRISSQRKIKTDHLRSKKPLALNLDDDDDNGSAYADQANPVGESNDVEPNPVGESIDVESVAEVSTSTQFSQRRPAAGTLVVCPASVLRQWNQELNDKVHEETKLKVLLYHGGNRTKDPLKLARYDVVLTTYSIVTNEVPKQPLVDDDEADEKNGDIHGLSESFSIAKKKKKVSNVSKRGKKGKRGNGRSCIDSGCGALAKVGWFRVVLDEAQTIKNHRTQVARACCSLRAKHRWCLSGTPIQNTIDDLYSYFRFLKYDPYAVYKSFYNTIKIPISRNSLHGYKKLQAVLRAIMLRRTKETLIDGEPIINLPPKTVCMSKVDFSVEERAFYKQIESDSFKKFKAYADAGTVSQNYANILLMLLRLRQACDHPLLVKEYNSDCVGKFSIEMARNLPREMLYNLLNHLETSSAICCVCSDPPDDPVVTMCGHVFCYQCVSEYITGDDNDCPANNCKEQLGEDVVFSKITLRSCISDDLGGSPTHSQLPDTLAVLQNDFVSAKIKAVLEILQSQCVHNSSISESQGFTDGNVMSEGFVANKHTTVHSNSPTDGPIKTIVFSQWTRMLDLVEFSMNQHGIQYRRLDGTMSLASRDRAVKDFNNDSQITVMLMSLKAGNLGLNMVAACHVILLDLWWNPTTEDQAVDRAHRIGQTRPVTVTRITIKDTVEDKIIRLQEEKRKMVASAFGEDQGGGAASRLTVEDLKFLFMV